LSCFIYFHELNFCVARGCINLCAVIFVSLIEYPNNQKAEKKIVGGHQGATNESSV